MTNMVGYRVIKRGTGFPKPVSWVQERDGCAHLSWEQSGYQGRRRITTSKKSPPTKKMMTFTKARKRRTAHISCGSSGRTKREKHKLHYARFADVMIIMKEQQ